MPTAARTGRRLLPLRAARAGAARYYRQEDMLRALKSGYAGVTAREADRLELYAMERGLEGRLWEVPIEENDAQAREEDGAPLRSLEEIRTWADANPITGQQGVGIALIGNTDFSQLRLDISKVRDITSSAVQSVEGIVTQGDAAQAAAAAEPIYWNYGAFIQQCVDFTILALCVFLMVKLMNRLMKKKEAAPAPAPEPPAPSKEELLLTEIRDLLKEQKK